MPFKLPWTFYVSATVALLCFLQIASARPMAGLPATQPGHLVGNWLKQCQAPNLEKMTSWLMNNLSDETVKSGAVGQVTTQLVEFCKANGGFRTNTISGSNSKHLSLVVVGFKSDIWFDLTLSTDDGGKIAGVFFSPTIVAESALPKDLSDASVQREVTKFVTKLYEEGLFSGIVVVARGSRVIVSASGGYANRANHSTITGRSQFTLASMGKLFTATAIGQLVDQHMLSFDDPVSKFFPEYPNKTVREKVTVAMLLSHTAGMGDFLDRWTPEMMKTGVKRAAQFLPLYDKDEPQFAPGTRWAYSNAGLALAGAIVEKVSGEDYPDYLRRHIFLVAGMAHSDPYNVPYHSEPMVTPYTKMTENGPMPGWQEAKPGIGNPAGGALSSAEDLVRFADALRRGELLSRTTFETMTMNHAPASSSAKYGYGVEIEEVYGRTFVGHSGGFPGVSSHFYMLLDSPYTVIVLANQDPPAEAYAGSKVIALIAEKAKLER